MREDARQHRKRQRERGICNFQEAGNPSQNPGVWVQPQQFPPPKTLQPYPQQAGFNYGYPPSWGFPNQFPGAYPQNQWVNPNTWQNPSQHVQGASTQQLPAAPPQPTQGASVGNPSLGIAKVLSKNQKKEAAAIEAANKQKGKENIQGKDSYIHVLPLIGNNCQRLSINFILS
jgi:hypothetical protein